MVLAKLTDKQEMFCKEYIVDFNATRAAKAAGYSDDTAAVIGCENLIKPNIQARLTKLKAKRAERVQISQDDVLRVLKQAIMFDIRKIYNKDGTLKRIQELDDDTAAAISSIDHDGLIGKTVKIKTIDKLSAVDKAARHLGIYEEDNRQSSSQEVIQYDWSKLTLEEKIAIKKAGIKNADDEG